MFNDQCLGLVIGNSRWHWAYFEANTLIEVWHSEHFATEVTPEILLSNLLPSTVVKKIVGNQKLWVYLASVVPSQTALWQSYPHLKEITLKDIPLKNLYPTMGIDRALALFGAGKYYGYPCLVIDGGTALTFTGVDDQQSLVGGAILPGLRSQFELLGNRTAQLPQVESSSFLPQRWTTNTPDAIRSGIIHTLVAGIDSFVIDWLKQFPNSQIVLTGGDSNSLNKYLQISHPELARKIIKDDNLIFRGLELIVKSHRPLA